MAVDDAESFKRPGREDLGSRAAAVRSCVQLTASMSMLVGVGERIL